MFAKLVRPGALLTAAFSAVLAAPLAAQEPATRQPWKAGSLAISEPSTVVALEGATLTGQPSRMSWSPDGNLLYIQTLEGSFGRPDAKLRHFLVASTGGALREMPAEPEWATDYWIVKSDQASPDDPSTRIEPKSEARRERTTSTPQGGDLARGGTSPVSSIGRDDAVDAAFNSQIAFMNTLLLHGRVIGEFDNTVIVPGLTFGWGPMGTQVIAYAETRKGRVTIMDGSGDRKEIAGTEAALLPAFSNDGGRLAWMEKAGRNKFVVRVARVEES